MQPCKKTGWGIFNYFFYLQHGRGHASVKPLGRPTILGFGNPSGSLEDGARGWEIYFSWSLHMFMGPPAIPEASRWHGPFHVTFIVYFDYK